MAKALGNTYDFSARTGGATALYDWKSYQDGQVWALTAGEDFEVTAETMRGQVIVAARKADLKVKTRLVKEEGQPDQVVFQFSEKTAADRQKEAERAQARAAKKAESDAAGESDEDDEDEYEDDEDDE